MEIDANKKSLIKKILLIVWIVALTAIFTYLAISMIQVMIDLHRIVKIDLISADSLSRQIRRNIFFLFLIAVLYSSFMALAVPKLIKSFRPSRKVE